MPLHILVIEDDPTWTKLLKDVLLSEMDVTVQYSRTMESANKLLHNIVVDAIILDINLPDIQWPESLKSLLSKHPSLPVICMTADPTHMKESILLGAADYLDKSGLEKENLERSLFKAVEINRRIQRALLVKNDIQTIKEEIQDATRGPDSQVP